MVTVGVGSAVKVTGSPLFAEKLGTQMFGLRGVGVLDVFFFFFTLCFFFAGFFPFVGTVFFALVATFFFAVFFAVFFVFATLVLLSDCQPPKAPRLDLSQEVSRARAPSKQVQTEPLLILGPDPSGGTQGSYGCEDFINC
jgi:hypothetical protein